MKPKGSDAGSGRKRGPRRGQKSTPNAEDSSKRSKKNQRDLHDESEESSSSDDQVENYGPTPGGSRRSRKKAKAAPSSSNIINSKNDIKEVSNFQMPIKGEAYVPKLMTKFDQSKPIKKTAPGPELLLQKRKKPTYEPKLTIKYDPNKPIKKDTPLPELTLERGLQKSGKNAN